MTRIRKHDHRWMSAFVGALLILGFPLIADTKASTGPSDAAILVAVEAEMQAETPLAFNGVDVAVKDGIVVFWGTAPTLAARDRASALAQRIKGVRSVVNTLALMPILRDDAEIRQRIHDALARDPAIRRFTFTTAVVHGVATLSGKVDSWAERELALNAAAQVNGVRTLRSQIEVVSKARRSNADVVADIRSRLKWDAGVDDDRVTVSVDEGRAILTGSVGSAWERSRAISDAWIAGVHAVVASGLTIDSGARETMIRAYDSTPTDEQIRRAISRAFRHDPRVIPVDPTVDVASGVVTLSGVVGHLNARHAAERDARDTVGVLYVRNHLAVRANSRPSDEALKQSVATALREDPALDGTGITVSAWNGQVSLNGNVGSAYQRARAESVAAGMPGILLLDDNLAVISRGASGSDQRIRHDIEEQLNWSPFVDADEVHVTVRDGIETLNGTVDTPRNAAGPRRTRSRAARGRSNTSSC